MKYLTYHQINDLHWKYIMVRFIFLFWRNISANTERTDLNNSLLTGCQVLLWNKPIKSRWNQSVQLCTKTGLEISIDFGQENMWQYVANLH